MGKIINNILGATMRKLLLVPLTIMCLAVLPNRAEAEAIFGVLDISGGVRVTADTIDWFEPFGPPDGHATVEASSTGSFAGLEGTIDTQLDLNISVVAGVGLPLDFYQTLEARPTWNFVLQDVLSCAEVAATAVPPLLCPLPDPNSPFAFSQTFPGGTTITMVMTGIVFDTMTPELVSTWTGIYTAQFPGQPIFTDLVLPWPNQEGVVDEFVRMGFIDTSFSASKITVTRPVPEPVALGLLGLGFLGVGIRARRRC